MKSRILHTIQNSRQLVLTHVLVNYAFSVIHWDEFELYPEPINPYVYNKNPKSGTFSILPARKYNVNKVELRVYGLHGQKKDLLNRFELPVKFADPGEINIVLSNKYVVNNIPVPGDSFTLLLRLDKAVSYPSIQVEMSNINKYEIDDIEIVDECDAYFTEQPKLLFDVTDTLSLFNTVTERIESDNIIYDSLLTAGGGNPSDDYEPIPTIPSWEA